MWKIRVPYTGDYKSVSRAIFASHAQSARLTSSLAFFSCGHEHRPAPPLLIRESGTNSMVFSTTPSTRRSHLTRPSRRRRPSRRSPRFPVLSCPAPIPRIIRSTRSYRRGPSLGPQGGLMCRVSRRDLAIRRRRGSRSDRDSQRVLAIRRHRGSRRVLATRGHRGNRSDRASRSSRGNRSDRASRSSRTSLRLHVNPRDRANLKDPSSRMSRDPRYSPRIPGPPYVPRIPGPRCSRRTLGPQCSQRIPGPRYSQRIPGPRYSRSSLAFAWTVCLPAVFCPKPPSWRVWLAPWPLSRLVWQSWGCMWSLGTLPPTSSPPFSFSS